MASPRKTSHPSTSLTYTRPRAIPGAPPTSTIGADPNLFRTLLIDVLFPLTATRRRALSAPENSDIRLTERRAKTCDHRRYLFLRADRKLRRWARPCRAMKETCEY